MAEVDVNSRCERSHQADEERVKMPAPAAPAAPAVPGARSQLNGLEIWFVTGSQHLYGEETLRQVAEQSRAIAGALAAADAIPVRVVWQPVVTTPEEIRRVMLAAGSDDSV